MKKILAWKSLVPFACLIAALSAPLNAQEPAPSLRVGTSSLALPNYRAQLSISQSSPAADSAGTALTLEQLLEIARTSNPTLAQAKAGIQAAAGRTLQAGLWPNPTIGYAGDEIRGGAFGGGEQGLFVQQDIILGGKLGLDRKVLLAEGKQTEAEAEEQRLRVENGVRVAFYQSLAAQKIVEIRVKLNGLAKDAAQTTQQLFNVGQADEPDLLQAQVEADQADLAVVTSQQDQRRAWQVLSAVVGRPTMPVTPLQGSLEDLPSIDAGQVIQTIVRDSPAVKIAKLGVIRAEASLTRARREIVPNLSLRAGLSNDFEPLGAVPPPRVGLIGFAEVGVNLRLFNRNQGNMKAAEADVDRATFEVQRVSLVLRQIAAPVLQSYEASRSMAEKYKASTLPNAQRAYELYLKRYREGAAAYPQVLIAQRTLFDLQASYMSALEAVWINATTLQGLLLTDGLDMPAAPGEIDRPVREINMPIRETGEANQ